MTKPVPALSADIKTRLRACEFCADAHGGFRDDERQRAAWDVGGNGLQRLGADAVEAVGVCGL